MVAEDEFGCRDTLDITIMEEAEIILNIDNVVGVVCNTTNTGSIEVTPTGGVGGFTLAGLTMMVLTIIKRTYSP